MTDIDLGAIRAREQAAAPHAAPCGCPVCLSQQDVPALIAAVQRRDDALAAVLALCDEREAAYRRVFQTPAQVAAFGDSMPNVQVDVRQVRAAITAHLTPADSPTTED